MMDWLFTIFETNSDQARLITVVFSALIAMFILLLNQSFINRRNKRDLLVQKVEDLYVLSIEYSNTCQNILDDIKNNEAEVFEIDPAKSNKVTELIRRMEMICGLHFNGAGFDSNDYRLWNMPIIEFETKENYRDETEHHMAYEDSQQHIVDADAKLAVICKKLMNKHGH